MLESPLLEHFKEGHNNMKIIDAIHVRPRKIGAKKYSDEVLYVIYYDVKEKRKKLKTIVKPEVDIWFVKKEYRDLYKKQRSYLPEFKCYRKRVAYKDRRKMISQEIREHDGPNSYLMKMINAAYQMGNYGALNEVYKWRYSMYSNFNLDDHMILMWNLNMEPDIVPLSKVYLDIESDVLERISGKLVPMSNERTQNGEAPINACTLIFNHKEDGSLEKEYSVHTFLLRDHSLYPQQEDFENNLDKFKDRCHEEFDEKFRKAKYNVSFYDSEISMIAAIFHTLNKYKSDICLIWNMGYEVPQFSQRIQAHGRVIDGQFVNYKPEQFFSHPDFKKGHVFFYKDSEREQAANDKKKFTDIANKTIYLNNSGYTKWMCQMVNYAAFRKGGHDYGGNSLDNVGYIEAGATKREFDGRNTNVLNAAVYEYFNFVLYNIVDVWIQVVIDEKTTDSDKVYGTSMNSCMSMNKAHKTTHLVINNEIKNLFDFPKLQEGAPRFIIGNNLNSY